MGCCRWSFLLGFVHIRLRSLLLCTPYLQAAERGYQCLFRMFKFEQLYYEQLWITEIILKATDAANTLYIHVECNGDTTRFEKVPIIRTDIIRAFVNSKYIAPTEIPITSLIMIASISFAVNSPMSSSLVDSTFIFYSFSFICQS